MDGPPGWDLGEVLTTPHHKKTACYEMLYRVFDRAQWQALLNTVMNLHVPSKLENFLIS
jgi:hypothetical protein